ncbi:TPA: oligosaccharide repeat unit polymerase, partial [Escherichia coli]
EVFCSLYSGQSSVMIHWNNYYSRPIIMSSYKVVLTLCILSCALVFYYIVSIYPAPLSMALQGASADEIAVRRLEVTKNYSGIGYFKT